MQQLTRSRVATPISLIDSPRFIGTIGFSRNQIPEAEQALREAEELVNDATALRKQAALAATQGECCMRLGAPERALAAFRRQGELYRRAGAELGEYLALGNVGSAQLETGEVDAAIESLRKAVDGLRLWGANSYSSRERYLKEPTTMLSPDVMIKRCGRSG